MSLEARRHLHNVIVTVWMLVMFVLICAAWLGVFLCLMFAPTFITAIIGIIIDIGGFVLIAVTSRKWLNNRKNALLDEAYG